jgi:acyl dehydratase
MSSRIINVQGVEALAPLLGTEVAISDWFVIEQGHVQRFAEATGDLQWIHVDAERATRESPFQAPVAHGYLTLSLLPMWMQQCVHIDGLRMGVNYGLNRVRFPAPVPVGSRLRCHFHLHAIDRIDDGVQAQWNIQVEREGEAKPVCIAEWLLRYYPESSAGFR